MTEAPYQQMNKTDFDKIVGEIPAELDVNETDVKSMVDSFTAARVDGTELHEDSPEMHAVERHLSKKDKMKTAATTKFIDKLRKAGYSNKEIITAIITKTDPLKMKTLKPQLEKEKALKKKKKKQAAKSRQRNRG